MARTQITLYGDDAARFERLKDRVADERPGGKPSNAEMVRVLMDEADVGQPRTV